MRGRLLLSAMVLTVPSQAAWAQSGDRVGSGISAIAGVIGGAIAQGRLNRDVAAMSAPLEYQSSNIPLDPANPQDPRNFDVAGLRIGMTPDEVKGTLMRGGYTIERTGTQLSFDTEVRQQAQGKVVPSQNLVPGHMTAKAPHAQELFIDFIALPEGPRLSSVRFEMTTPDMTPGAFAAQVVRKYGDTAMQSDGDRLLWCAAPDGCEGQWSQHAYLRVDLHAKTIQLSDFDEGRDAALAARIQAEVGRRKPQVQEARF